MPITKKTIREKHNSGDTPPDSGDNPLNKTPIAAIPVRSVKPMKEKAKSRAKLVAKKPKATPLKPKRNTRSSQVLKTNPMTTSEGSAIGVSSEGTLDTLALAAATSSPSKSPEIDFDNIPIIVTTQGGSVTIPAHQYARFPKATGSTPKPSTTKTLEKPFGPNTIVGMALSQSLDDALAAQDEILGLSTTMKGQSSNQPPKANTNQQTIPSPPSFSFNPANTAPISYSPTMPYPKCNLDPLIKPITTLFTPPMEPTMYLLDSKPQTPEPRPTPNQNPFADYTIAQLQAIINARQTSTQTPASILIPPGFGPMASQATSSQNPQPKQPVASETRELVVAKETVKRVETVGASGAVLDPILEELEWDVGASSGKEIVDKGKQPQDQPIDEPVMTKDVVHETVMHNSPTHEAETERGDGGTLRIEEVQNEQHLEQQVEEPVVKEVSKKRRLISHAEREERDKKKRKAEEDDKKRRKQAWEAEKERLNKKAEEAARKKIEAEERLKAEAVAKKKAEAEERKRIEAEERKKAEAEEKRKQERAREVELARKQKAKEHEKAAETGPPKKRRFILQDSEEDEEYNPPPSPPPQRITRKKTKQTSGHHHAVLQQSSGSPAAPPSKHKKKRVISASTSPIDLLSGPLVVSKYPLFATRSAHTPRVYPKTLVHAYPELKRVVEAMKWETLFDCIGEYNLDWVREFFTELAVTPGTELLVKQTPVSYSAEAINELLGLTPPVESEYDRLQTQATPEDYDMLIERLSVEGSKWDVKYKQKILKGHTLKGETNVWFYFMRHTLFPTSHDTDLDMDRVYYLYCIVEGHQFDVGALISKAMRYNIEKGNKQLPYPTIIQKLLEKAKVPSLSTDKFNRDKVVIDKQSLLRLLRFPNAPEASGQTSSSGLESLKAELLDAMERQTEDIKEIVKAKHKKLKEKLLVIERDVEKIKKEREQEALHKMYKEQIKEAYRLGQAQQPLKIPPRPKDVLQEDSPTQSEIDGSVTPWETFVGFLWVSSDQTDSRINTDLSNLAVTITGNN
ncbi:hypothetical protein OSB04_023330 [Centaurea solstitialis]|uniref:Putative plant transposon protein domain-containing protein n=1 Tax=Centaurea solstitialis TaxID=347529 RepID=A0AA38T3M5_9ASTR|nr:hypothetical protein OSB04_023330 [Centaurea solstitialis]